jgi:hypothetical protein
MAEVASWVRACRSPVVPGTGIHAVALTPLVLWTVWWSWTTFAITLASTVAFVTLEIKGRRPVWLIARSKSLLRGQFVAARPVWYLRRRSRLHSYADINPARAWADPACRPVEGCSRDKTASTGRPSTDQGCSP